MGLYNTELGNYRQADEPVRLAIGQRPDFNIYFGNLANYLLGQQRLDEARETIVEAHARKLDDFVLRAAAYGLDFLSADQASMNAELQWLANRPEAAFLGLAAASDSLAYGGQLQQARAVTTRAVGASIKADSKEYAGLITEWSAIRETAYGNRAQGRQDAEAGLKFSAESQAVRSLAGMAPVTVALPRSGPPSARPCARRW